MRNFQKLSAVLSERDCKIAATRAAMLYRKDPKLYNKFFRKEGENHLIDIDAVLKRKRETIRHWDDAIDRYYEMIEAGLSDMDLSKAAQAHCTGFPSWATVYKALRTSLFSQRKEDTSIFSYTYPKIVDWVHELYHLHTAGQITPKKGKK